MCRITHSSIHQRRGGKEKSRDCSRRERPASSPSTLSESVPVPSLLLAPGRWFMFPVLLARASLTPSRTLSHVSLRMFGAFSRLEGVLTFECSKKTKTAFSQEKQQCSVGGAAP